MNEKIKFYLQFKGKTEEIEYELKNKEENIIDFIETLKKTTLKNEIKKTDILLLKNKENKYLEMKEGIEIENGETIILEILSHTEEFYCGNPS
jgi:hypothetical protein